MDPDSVSIFNSPLLSIRLLFKIFRRWAYAGMLFLSRHIALLVSFAGILGLLYNIPGPHTPYLDTVREFFLFMTWWLLLGVASSIGLGTGLHTFVLYLGPHIAKVTMVAYECNYIPNMLPSRWDLQTFEECPSPSTTEISIWTIILAVQLESFLWGVGTALGELPPYFIARAARIANTKTEELEELEHLNNKTFMDKAKRIIYISLQKYGFITVLLCASIPNPLFDLAGLLCGHFGISLPVFLGATIIGKAFIKVHIQMIFTIFLFSKQLIGTLLSFIESEFPVFEDIIKESLEKQKKLLHSTHGSTQDKPIIARIWEVVVILMIAYFLISFFNALVREELRGELDTVESYKTKEVKMRITKKNQKTKKSKGKKKY